MSVDGKRHGAWQVIDIAGAFGAMIAAVVSLFAFVFSNPTNVGNWWQRTRHGYSVQITSPKNDAGVTRFTDIAGTAKVPKDWSLVVLQQTPDELKYYVSSGGALYVDPDTHQWELPEEEFGEGKCEDQDKDYKIFAVLVDAQDSSRFKQR